MYEDRRIAYREHSNTKLTYRGIFSLDLAARLETIEPDAVYYFNFQPLILFFDFSSTMTREELESRKQTIFKRAWCLDKSPVIFMIDSQDIQIFNAFRYQRNLDGKNSLESITLADDQLENRFSFWELESGRTWEWIDEAVFKKSIERSRVNYVLFSNILFASESLSGLGLSKEFSNLLILRLIFCRYLIDRGVEFNPQYLRGKSVDERKQRFNEILSDEDQLQALFKYLKGRFNGNLFVTDDDEKLKPKALTFISGLFAGNLSTNQPFLFDVFDFSIIPVEIISSIYETVIGPDDKKTLSSVYTPTFLVDYVVDKTVLTYLNASGENQCKILDPSCGSGIFLVQLYRRMIERQREINDDVLISVLTKNIFGIDRDINALNVAIFSIYVALLDYKNPKTLIDFKLPALKGKNLFRGDFFDTDADYNKQIEFKSKSFKFIIGNPPWGRKNDGNQDAKHLEYIASRQLPIAKFEISQTFLYRSGDFSGANTECAFIITSKALYNQWSDKFKKHFFQHYFVDEILDLSPVRRIIFSDALNPAAVVKFRPAFGQPTQKHVVSYASVKANLFLRNFKILVIEKQDRKQVQQELLSTYSWIFKTLLYGNELDLAFLKRLSGIPYKISDLISDTPELVYGDGLLKRSKKSDTDAAYRNLIGLPKILTDSLTDFSHTPNAKVKVTDDDIRVKSGGDIQQYKGTKVLFKARTKNESEVFVSVVEKDALYLHCTFGITSKKRPDLIYELFSLFKSNLFAYYQFLTSANWGVYIPEIQLTEYLSFPYLEAKRRRTLLNSLENTLTQINSARGKTLVSEGEEDRVKQNFYKTTNKVIDATYEVDEIEASLMSYFLEVSRYQFQESKYENTVRPFTNDNRDLLKGYAEVFYRHFSQIYNRPGEYFQIDIYPLKWFIAMQFRLVDALPNDEEKIRFVSENNPDRVIFDILSKKMSINEVSNSVFEQKDLKGFEKDFFYLIKPNEYKSWHPAMAHRDLAEFMGAIHNASVSNINYETAV